MLDKLRKNKALQGLALSAIQMKNKLRYKSSVVKAYNTQRSSFELSEILDYNEHRLYGYQSQLCHAPFNSLYLEARGRVYACCMSGNYVLGDISDQTLTEIWNGEQANILRDDILAQDFSKACMKCAKAIKGGVHDQAMSASYDTIPTRAKTKFPERIDFELSNTCNLACIMCNGKNSSTYRLQVDKEEERPMAYGGDFLNDLNAFLPYLKRANFLGGEPFLIDIYYQIWERLLEVNPNCNLFVQTNGQVLNKRIKKLLNSGRFNIGVSFESIDKQRFERIRQFGKYDRMVANIKWFSQYCLQKGHHFTFAITPLRQTVHELPEFVKYANEMGAEIYFNIAVEPHELVIWTLPPKEIEALLKPLRSARLPKPSNALERTNQRQYTSYLTQLENWKLESIENEKKIAAISAHSTDELIENIKGQIEEMVQTEMRYNSKYEGEYEVEKQQMFSSLELMRAPEFNRSLRLMVVMGADRMTSALAKMPENKRALMSF